MFIILVSSLKTYVKILNYICTCIVYYVGFPGGAIIKKPPANAGDKTDLGSILDWKIPWGKKWQPIPVILPGNFHGQWSLVDYSPWGCKESTRLSD